MDRRWIVGALAGWIAILLLDELTYYWWRSLNPGSMYSGLVIKHPTQENPYGQ